MKSRVLWLILLSALFFFISCDEFPMSGNQSELEQTEFRLPSSGGEVKVTFIPLSSWSVSCSDSFVHLNPSSGEKSEDAVTLMIRVEENKASDERKIKVLLSFETNDIVLTIIQEGAISDNPDDPGDHEDQFNGTGSTEDVIPANDNK